MRPDPAQPSATSRFDNVQGLRMHARVAGHGQDVVLVHGLMASHRYWEPTLRLLSRHARIWAPDLPGHGRSAKPARTVSVDERADAVAAWMDAAGIGRAHFVGNSAGCQVVAALGQRYPARVKRLVLQGPTIDPHAHSFPRQAARWVHAMLREPYRPIRLALRDLRDIGLVRAVRQTRRVFCDRIEQRLPDIQAPTLIVRGERDPIVPRRWAEEAARMLPDGRLKVVPAAHIMNKTQPEVLVDVVLEFLELAGPGR